MDGPPEAGTRWDGATVQRARRLIFGCRQMRKGAYVASADNAVKWHLWRYFGRFSSEKRARECIAAHVCLTKQVTRK